MVVVHVRHECPKQQGVAVLADELHETHNLLVIKPQYMCAVCGGDAQIVGIDRR